MRVNSIIFLVLVSVPGLLMAKPVVGVSILPVKYFVERIAGDSVDVIVIVDEGYNPVTYEPKPQQLSRLSQAVVFFTVGVPFEEKWMRVFKNNNPDIKLVSLTEKIELREFNTGSGDYHSDNGHAHKNELDPHFWLSPILVKIASNTIAQTLSELSPENLNLYTRNYQVFADELDNLDQYIRTRFDKVSHKEFAVFHPSWGYFADAYGLKQVAIQVQNRQSGARSLHTIISSIRKNKIKVIFVQKQFSDTDATMVARETGARVLQLNPLSENYIENMKEVANLFAEALQ